MEDTTQIGAQRHEISVAKYHHGHTPEDGDPDETVNVIIWTEADGTPITDDARIAALDESIKEGQESCLS